MCIYFIAALSFLFIARYFCTKIASFDYKRLRSWSREVWSWLCRGKDVFGGAFVVFASVMICWQFGWNSKAFTVSGCALELAGMMQATVSLLEVRNYFNLPPLCQVIKKWIREHPKFRYDSINTANSELSLGGMSCHASGGPGMEKDDPNKPINDRIDVIYRNIDIIFNSYIPYHSNRIEELRGRIDEVTSNMKINLEVITENNKKELEQLHVGDFTPTLVGFAWIAAGTIMGAIGSWLS